MAFTLLCDSFDGGGAKDQNIGMGLETGLASVIHPTLPTGVSGIQKMQTIPVNKSLRELLLRPGTLQNYQHCYSNS